MNRRDFLATPAAFLLARYGMPSQAPAPAVQPIPHSLAFYFDWRAQQPNPHHRAAR